MASIRNLRRDIDSLKWEWDIDGVHYSTNSNGEGLWEERVCGVMAYADGRRGTATAMKQIAGTAQYNMNGCNSYGSAYTHIRRWFDEM